MYLASEPSQVRRYFGNVAGRRVHYRRAGSGPPLLLFHQSPTSSAELASEIVVLARRFTVIAADTPGYGWSDPLPQNEPEIADFADAAVALLDILGIPRAGLYGTHTGAMIAADLAVRHPTRVTAAVLDGFVVLGDEERADLLAHYFATPAPSPDGGHLTWAWSRIRDQALFFPWYRKTRSARMRFDVPTAAALQPYLLDLLRAHELGVPAYRAAFAYDARAAARSFSVPTWLLNYPADAIVDHPERLSQLSPLTRREMAPDQDRLLDRACYILAAACKALPEPPLPPVGVAAGIVKWGGIQTRIVVHGRGPTVLLLHEPGASLRTWDCVVQNDQFAWHALDLPGHGAADNAVPDDHQLTAGLRQLATSCGARAVVAMGASGWLARVAMAASGVPVITVDLPADAPVWPDCTPQDHGAHLLAAWQAVRDSELFAPWNRALLAHALDREFAIDPRELTRRSLDVLTAAPALARLTARLAKLANEPGEILIQALRTGRGIRGPTEAVRWPDEPQAWSQELIHVLRQIVVP